MTKSQAIHLCRERQWCTVERTDAFNFADGATISIRVAEIDVTVMIFD
jgi:hypothetical protein